MAPSLSPLASRQSSPQPKRIVVKLGTGVLTHGIGQLDTERIAGICAQIAAFRKAGTEVIVVSSGAVGLGMGRLGLTRKPKEVTKKQACAAVGQSLLMQTWQRGFDPHGLTVAQVLLTREDLRARDRHLSIKSVINQLVAYDTIPIINENDAVSAAEIDALLKFGDNDTLGAMVAALIEAQHLVILSTAPGLIDMKGTKEIVPVVDKITPEIEAMAGGTTSETATGGMISKISAAKLALKAGCGVFIASGAVPEILPKLFAGQGPGTFFVPSGLPMESRKRWLAFYQRPAGTLYVNARAVPVLRNQGSSLLAVGITGVEGTFGAGDIVNVAFDGGGEKPTGDLAPFARGKTAYSSDELARIVGKHGDEFRALFPGRKRLDVIHRDDLALL